MKNSLAKEALYFVIGWGVLLPMFVSAFSIIGGSTIATTAIDSGKKTAQKLLISAIRSYKPATR